MPNNNTIPPWKPLGHHENYYTMQLIWCIISYPVGIQELLQNWRHWSAPVIKPTIATWPSWILRMVLISLSWIWVINFIDLRHFIWKEAVDITSQEMEMFSHVTVARHINSSHLTLWQVIARPSVWVMAGQMNTILERFYDLLSMLILSQFNFLKIRKLP